MINGSSTILNFTFAYSDSTKTRESSGFIRHSPSFIHQLVPKKHYLILFVPFLKNIWKSLLIRHDQTDQKGTYSSTMVHPSQIIFLCPRQIITHLNKYSLANLEKIYSNLKLNPKPKIPNLKLQTLIRSIKMTSFGIL